MPGARKAGLFLAGNHEAAGPYEKFHAIKNEFGLDYLVVICIQKPPGDLESPGTGYRYLHLESVLDRNCRLALDGSLIPALKETDAPGSRLVLRKMDPPSGGKAAKLVGIILGDKEVPIGIWQMLILHTLFCGKETKIDGQGCMVVTEEEFMKQLKSWLSKHYVAITGADKDKPEHRFEKMWTVFMRMMNRHDIGEMFTKIKDAELKRYVMRLRRDEINNEIQHLHEVAKAYANHGKRT